MSRWIRRAPLLIAAVAAVALTAACGSSSTSTQPQGSSSPLSSTPKPTASGAPSTSANAQLTVTDDQAKQLCDLIRPQLSDWRVQTPTLDKISLNTTVAQWALQTGVNVLSERGVVDRVTIKSCPDVRDEALKAIEIPDLASGLVAG
ncbi:hypothetical protein GPX89_40455 [Nocardia sp. ET3-3]|uniref:DUF732 domain-containing protein n=1 Tax=Nocardia terrae TaxID=2675851 RepID=A0A7K1VAA5_9NOCA|nr:hypothetical protein [Nocardia terrae]MVU83497.1 hypothetical protein [Nocardia terrae]